MSHRIPRIAINLLLALVIALAFSIAGKPRFVSADTVEGNCGVSWLYVSDLGGGWARYRFGFSSKFGDIFSYSYTLLWSGPAGYGSLGGGESPFLSRGHEWSEERDVYVGGPGIADGTIQGRTGIGYPVLPCNMVDYNGFRATDRVYISSPVPESPTP
jgi:hypothetical protein